MASSSSCIVRLQLASDLASSNEPGSSEARKWSSSSGSRAEPASSKFCKVWNLCSSSESSFASSILEYLDGGVTNSTPVAAGVGDSSAGFPGVDEKSGPSGAGSFRAGEDGESGPG